MLRCKHRGSRVKVSFSFCCLIILILIIRVLIRGDFFCNFYTSLSKFWNYYVHPLLCLSNDINFFYFLELFPKSQSSKEKQEYFSFKNLINFYHRSEFLSKIIIIIIKPIKQKECEYLLFRQ